MFLRDERLDVRGHFLVAIGLISLTVGGKWLVDGALIIRGGYHEIKY